MTVRPLRRPRLVLPVPDGARLRPLCTLLILATPYFRSAIAIARSGARREEPLLTGEELRAVSLLRKGMSGLAPVEVMGRLTGRLKRTASNADFVVELIE